jgi:hypothetical protein
VQLRESVTSFHELAVVGIDQRLLIVVQLLRLREELVILLNNFNQGVPFYEVLKEGLTIERRVIYIMLHLGLSDFSSF